MQIGGEYDKTKSGFKNLAIVMAMSTFAIFLALVFQFKDGIKPRMDVTLTIHRADGKTDTVPLTCRIDTLDEVEYFRHGGILQYVLRGLLKAA